MSRPPKPDPDEKIIPGSSHTPALPFDAIQDMIVAAVAMWIHLKGFTYNPKSDTIFDLERLYDGLALYQELLRANRNFRGDLPIYLIAVTNHLGTIVGNVLRDAYQSIILFSNIPLIGYWVETPERTFLDGVVAMQFINEDDAIRAGKRYGQKFIVKISPNGSYDHLEAN